MAREGNISIDKAITLNGGGSGDGGDVLLYAEEGNIAVNAGLTANGSGAGVGGSIQVSATGDIAVANALAVKAQSNGEAGGFVSLLAGGGITTQSNASISARGTADAGAGGTVNINAGTDVQLNAIVDVSGGDDGAGGAWVTGGRDITLNARLDARGRSAGDPGGYVYLSAGVADLGGTLAVNQTIDVTGGVCGTGSGCGLAGAADLIGCRVAVANSAGQVLATGEAGRVSIVGRQYLTVDGTVSAKKRPSGSTDGTVDIYIVTASDGGIFSAGGSATIEPTPTVNELEPCLYATQEDCLLPCGPCDGLATGTTCTDGVFCNGADRCTSEGACEAHAGDPCAGGGDCADSCSEEELTCLEGLGTPCTDDDNPCTVDLCDGSGTCTHTAGNAESTCREAASGCDIEETCTGSSEICPADVLANSTVACRPAAGECDLPETCTGTHPDCPEDVLKTDDAPCADDDNPCTTDLCTGSSVECQHTAGNLGATCRAAAGACDVQETCTGTSMECPADALGSSTTECRAAAGACDLAELCSGTETACPADVRKAAETACTDDENACTADQCDGTSTECQHPPADPGVCRTAAGPCDQEEFWICDGTTPACPADALLPSGTECRSTAGDCDLPETCTGTSVDCPADAVKANDTPCTDDANPCTTDRCDGSSTTCHHAAGNVGVVCRPGGGACDVAETCTGTSTECPADALLPSTAECRASAGDCDIAENCTGTDAQCPEDLFLPDTTECRASAGECDPAEFCTATTGVCPADARAPAETSCTSDGNPCTADECDGTAVDCQHSAANALAICRESAGSCDVEERCTGTSTECPTDQLLPDWWVCRSAADDCDAVETCTGTSAGCPADAVKASAEPCSPDDSPCTVDECDGTSLSCQHVAGNEGDICHAAEGFCELAARCTGSSTECPANAPADQGEECRVATSECDVAELCSGSDADCPADDYELPGTACSDDEDACTVDQCDGSGTCGHPQDPAINECVLPLTLVRTIAAPTEDDVLFGLTLAALPGPSILSGAPGRLSGGFAHGIAYVLDAASGAVLQTLVNPSSEEEDDYFGAALAAVPTGTVAAIPPVVIAASRATADESAQAGQVFRLAFLTAAVDAAWTAESPVTAGHFGEHVALWQTGEAYHSVITSPGTAAGYRYDGGAQLAATYSDPWSSSVASGVAVTTAGPFVVIGNYGGDGYLNVFDADSGDVLQTLYTPGEAAGAYGYALASYDPVAGDPERTLPGGLGELFPSPVILATLWHPDGGEGAAYLLDPDGGDVVRAFTNPDAESGFGLSVAGAGPRIAVTGAAIGGGGEIEASAVHLFNPATGGLLQTLANPDEQVPGFGIALLAIGDSLVVGAADPEAPQAGAIYIYAPCGDAKLDAGEQCDDGNLDDDDGCSSTCQLEAEEDCQFIAVPAAAIEATVAAAQYYPPDEPSCWTPDSPSGFPLLSFAGPLLWWNPIYIKTTALLRWDTSALPAETVATRAWLRLLGVVLPGTDTVIAADWHTWGPECAPEDAAPSDADNALSSAGLCGDRCVLSANTDPNIRFYRLELDDVAAHVDPEGSTFLRLHIPDDGIFGQNGLLLSSATDSPVGPTLVLHVCPESP